MIRFSVLSLLSLFCVTLASANEANHIPMQFGNDGHPIWRLGDNTEVTAPANCYQTEAYGFWPEVSCGGWLKVSGYGHYMRQSEARRKNRLPPQLKVESVTYHPGIGDYSQEKPLFDALFYSSQPVLVYNSDRYLLEGFHEYARQRLKDEREAFQPEISKERWLLVSMVAGTVIGGILGLVTLVYVWRRLCRVVPSLFMRASRAWGDRKIRQLAIKETVLHSTRDTLQNASSSQSEAIRREISKAVAKGDTDLAASLSTVLRDVEAGQGSTSSNSTCQ